MIIKAGTKLTVVHSRKGKFEGIAKRDFDTEKDEFYPIATLEYVEGMANEWEAGEEVPCRNTLCKIYPHESCCYIDKRSVCTGARFSFCEDCKKEQKGKR